MLIVIHVFFPIDSNTLRHVYNNIVVLNGTPLAYR